MSQNVNVSLDPQTWMWLQISVWIVIGLIVGLICVVAAWIIQEYWLTPLESKVVRKASRKKKPLLILERDDGALTFQIAYKIGPEGILETLPKSKKDKRYFTGLVARNIEGPQLGNLEGATDAEKKAAEKTGKIGELLADFATKKTYLEGARIPALVGYYGKSILTRIGHLAGMQTLENLGELKQKGNSPSLNPEMYFAKTDEFIQSLQDNDVTKRLKGLFEELKQKLESKVETEAFVPIDLTTIKTLFGLPWDETQLAAQAQQKYQEGYWKGRKDSGGNEPFKTILLMLIVVFGLLAAIVVIMKFL